MKNICNIFQLWYNSKDKTKGITKVKKTAKIIYMAFRVGVAVLLIYMGILYLASNDPAEKANCLFVCGQSALFIIVSFLPTIIDKFNIDIPDFVYLVFLGFLIAHFLLGEIIGFFATIKWWDSALHTLSGMLITLLSFSIITLLNRSNGEDFQLNLVFACIFAFCVSLTLGVLWEILEFSCDCIFDLNMQRAYVSTVSGERGAPLLGQEALMDTMKDLILDCVGSLAVCIASGVYVTKTGKGVKDLTIIRYRGKKISSEENSETQQSEENMEVEEGSETQKIEETETEQSIIVETKTEDNEI